jgi:hypothetical protein
MVVFTMDAAQALRKSQFGINKFTGTTYKYPKLRIASNVSFVRIFTCRVHTMGIGSDAKSISVRILMTELNIPIAVKRLLSKHFAFGSLA